MFLYVLCLEHRLSFSTRVSVQSLANVNQQRTLTRILSTSCGRLRPTCLDGSRIHNFSIDNLCLITRTLPLLTKLKAINFMQWNQTRILKSFEDYFQLSTFPNPTCLYNILVLQRYKSAIVELKEREEIMMSRVLSTASDDRLDSLMIIALHKYILKNIHSLYWKNDRQIILYIVQKFPRIFFVTNIIITSDNLLSAVNGKSYQGCCTDN